MHPPSAKKKPRLTQIHGVQWNDDYYWMRNREDPEVISYLESENKYMQGKMAHLEELQKTLYDEMLARIKEDDNSVPYRKDDYFYYSRTESGKPYRIYCRKHQTLEAPEEIILDGNALAEGKEYMRIGSMAMSPDHKILAYSVDYEGSERYQLNFKNLADDHQYDEIIPDTYYSLAWANDNQTLFYTIVDEASRPYKLFRHILGSDPKSDSLVYHESDEAFFLSVSKSRSKQFIFIDLDSAITSEVRFLDANKSQGQFEVFRARTNGVEYCVEHHTDRFYILTNENAENFKLLETPITKIAQENWTLVIEETENVTLSGVDAFEDFLVVYERQEGLPQIRITELSKKLQHKIKFEDASYDVWSGNNPDFNTTVLRFGYSSMLRPDSVFDYSMDSRDRILKKESPVLGYNRHQYTDERIWAEASDGTKVPVSLLYKKGLERDGENPVLLFGYGSYGYSYDADFDSDLFSLVDRGFVVAIAHIRGGGELGRKWKNAGKFEHKLNTFTDFIACAEHLVNQGYTSPSKLVISGRSAGGLLMGAVINMRPDLFHAVIAGVPFVDVINTMLDETIPLTVIEWEEWGNPKDKKYFEYMRAYSPYDNVRAVDHPHILVLAGLNDPRVQYWEPAKWTAKIRDVGTGENLLIMKTDMGAGHGGNSGRYGHLKDTAFEYAFILDRVNNS